MTGEDLTRVFVRLVSPKRLLRDRNEAAYVTVPLAPLLWIDVADQVRGDAVLECRAISTDITEEIFQFEMDSLDVLLEIMFAGHQQPTLRAHLFRVVVMNFDMSSKFSCRREYFTAVHHRTLDLRFCFTMEERDVVPEGS